VRDIEISNIDIEYQSEKKEKEKPPPNPPRGTLRSLN
jgi:hypothetical protein